jgi:hypothetical protein
MKTAPQSDNVTYTSIKNWWPIILGVIAICGFLYSIKVDQVRQGDKIDRIVTVIEKLEPTVNGHEVRITVLESRKTSDIRTVSVAQKPQEIQISSEAKVSETSASPVPAPTPESSPRSDEPRVIPSPVAIVQKVIEGLIP